METSGLDRPRDRGLYLGILFLLLLVLVSGIQYQWFSLPVLENIHSPMRRISAEIVNFQDLEVFERLEAVRDWVYRNTDVAADESLLLSYDEFPLHAITVDEMLELHMQDIGGHFCAGVNYILKRVYETLGHNSWMYSYGDADSLTHSVVLVEVDGLLYAQDAYFNVSYVDQYGQPLPFFEALKGLMAGNAPGQRIGPSLWRDVHLSGIHLTDRALSWVTAGMDRNTCKALKEDRFVCRSRTSVDTFIENHPLDQTYVFLSQREFPPSLHYLAFFPIGITAAEWIDDPEKSEILQRIIEIREGRLDRISMAFKEP